MPILSYPDMSNSIVACGQEIDIGCRVVKWSEPTGFSFYSGRKYAGRNIDLEKLRQEIKTCVLQHSNTYTAKQAYVSLITRGASVNFIIDDDNYKGFATIYQCLDIKDAGLSHAPLNQNGPGIQISYHAVVSNMAQAYSLINQQKYGVKNHVIVEDQVHGKRITSFCPSEAQVNSCVALLSGITKIFPDIPPYFPHDSYGKVIKTFIPNPENYRGLLANFHISRGKNDPSGFPFDQVEAQVSTDLLFSD